MNALAQMSNAIRAERERGKEERLADFSARFSRFAATRCQPAKKAGESDSEKTGSNTQPPPPKGEEGASGSADVPPPPEHTEDAGTGEETDTVSNADAAGEITTEQTDTPPAENAEDDAECQDAADSQPTDTQAEQQADGEAAESVSEATLSDGQHEDEQQSVMTCERAQTGIEKPVVAHPAPAPRKRRGINFKKGGHK